MGFGLAAVPDHRVDPAAGRAEQSDHAVVVPVVYPAEDDGGILGLDHVTNPSCTRTVLANPLRYAIIGL